MIDCILVCARGISVLGNDIDNTGVPSQPISQLSDLRFQRVWDIFPRFVRDLQVEFPVPVNVVGAVSSGWLRLIGVSLFPEDCYNASHAALRIRTKGHGPLNLMTSPSWFDSIGPDSDGVS